LILGIRSPSTLQREESLIFFSSCDPALRPPEGGKS
jgi:hypothetical protein